MDAERPGSRETGAAGSDNVVRFPREWFGPTEELLPIGPAARRSGVDSPAQPPDRSDDDAQELALGADAFWGEESAAIHQVVRAARPPEPAPEPVGFSSEGGRTLLGPVPDDVLPGPVPDPGGPRAAAASPGTVDDASAVRQPADAVSGGVRAGRGARPWLAFVPNRILGIALAACAALAIAFLGSHGFGLSGAKPSAHALAAAADGRLAGAATTPNASSMRSPLAFGIAQTGPRRSTRSRRRSPRSFARRTVRHRTVTRSKHAARSAAPAARTRPSTSAPSRSASTYQAPLTTAGGGGSAAEPVSTPASSGGGQTTHETTHSGPVGAGAPFGPGRLG